MAAMTSAALSAAARSPSGHPYTCTTCKALPRPACTTRYCILARSWSLRLPWIGRTLTSMPLGLEAATARR
eukprot:5060449-Lingulodinium_polyedra.AAC.1